MNTINFPQGKLSMTISDLMTLIYTTDTNISFIGTTDILITDQLSINNTFITVYSDHVTVNLFKMNKIIVLLKIDNVDLIHNLAHQIASLNNTVKKIMEVMNKCVRVQVSRDTSIIIGTRVLELCFTNVKIPSYSTVDKSVIYSDTNYYIDLYEEASLVECKELIVEDISTNTDMIFNWKNLPKHIETIVLTSDKIVNNFIANLDNVHNNVTNLQIKNFILTESILEIIASKWPDVLFNYNGMTFKFNILH